MRCSRLDHSIAPEACPLKRQNSFADIEHLCYDWTVKLLPAALQKQDYYLAAHVLVYGLVKASVKATKNSANPSTPLRTSLQEPHNCYDSRRKRQKKS